ncbi:MAG: glutamine amidotransferase [Wenzhouxiangella sp.]
MQLLIVKTGDTLPTIERRLGDFDHWFRAAFGAACPPNRVVEVHRDQALPTDLNGISGVLVTGSPAMVSHRLDWSERTAVWLADAHRAGLPMLGVCYGHQLIAHALGGEVGPNPAGRRIGTRDLTISAPDDPLLGSLLDHHPARVQVTHSEAVLALPPGARVIAHAQGDPHHAVHFGGKSWGLQFHPEFDRTIMQAYLVERREDILAEGLDYPLLERQLDHAPLGPAVLARFLDQLDLPDHDDGRHHRRATRPDPSPADKELHP